jgi:hypothetical protein
MDLCESKLPFDYVVEVCLFDYLDSWCEKNLVKVYSFDEFLESLDVSLY